MTLAMQEPGTNNRIRRFLDDPVRILMVAEGSGGHLVPALELTRVLMDAGASVTLLYPQRPQMASLMANLAREFQDPSVRLRPFSLAPCPVPFGRPLWRLHQAGSVWHLAQDSLQEVRPDAVVGFGGWFSVPVIVAAQRQEIPTIVHEQNVHLGRANRFLLDWIDQVAVSFEATRAEAQDVPVVVSGMPVRAKIGAETRADAAQRVDLQPDLPTLVVLGGSQGAHVVNQVMIDSTARWTDAEQHSWQVVHVTGAADEAQVKAAYAARRIRAFVASHVADMAAVYAMADLVVARAGASTIGELAQCGTPAVLIPYPHASGHQRTNAQYVEAAGAGIVLDEHQATPERLLVVVRHLMRDARLRQMMGRQMRTLAHPEAGQRLARAVLMLAAVQGNVNTMCDGA